MKTDLYITRNRVLIRAKYGWPRRSVPFSQNTRHHPDNYRTDAPGYLAMCYDIPVDVHGGPNVVTLLTSKWMVPIPREELKRGDAIGYLGPDALDADGGCIVLFDRWLNDDPATGTAITWDHLAVVGNGPDQRARPVDFRWHSYRYAYILDDDAN